MDKIVLIIGALVILFFIIRNLRKIKVIIPQTISVQEIPKVYNDLIKNGKDPSFAVFMFPANDHSIEENSINLQFSIENAKIGLDWVLLGSANIQERKLFENYMRKNRMTPVLKSLNGVDYLRVEGERLDKTCYNFLRTVYGFSNESEVDYIIELDANY